MPSHPRGLFRPSLAGLFRPYLKQGRREGRAPAGTRSPACAKERARGGRQVMPVARPSLRDGFHGVLRALLGERCTIAPVALRFQMRAPVGRHITAKLDARTPGVRTTRLLRPRTSSLGPPRLACAHRRGHSKTLSAPCRIAPEAAHEFPRPAAPSRADAVAATASRPASRDDRETPLVAGGMCRLVRQNRTSVNSNIFAKAYRPSTGVFCPSGSTTNCR